ncbi:MAG: hypothetical protein DMG30_06245 [Acidobacteria bacterium]|nr:MAG: hypothetical protein DMG30_06245 [Acidobacteriota bacterium]
MYRRGHGFNARGQKMEWMGNYEWFCANCLRMVDALSRHGRCPYCDSNAVDVAYRWNSSAVSHDDAQVGTMAPGLINAHP